MYLSDSVEAIGIDDSPKGLSPVKTPHEGELSSPKNKLCLSSLLRYAVEYYATRVLQDNLTRSMTSKRSFPFHFLQVLCITAPSPKTEQIIFAASAAFFLFGKQKE